MKKVAITLLNSERIKTITEVSKIESADSGQTLVYSFYKTKEILIAVIPATAFVELIIE